MIGLDLASMQAREVETHEAKCVNSSIANTRGIEKEIFKLGKKCNETTKGMCILPLTEF